MIYGQNTKGISINNWMDFRDMLMKHLGECDTKMKFDHFLTAILIGMGGVDTIQKTRKKMELPLLSKKEVEEMKEEIEGKNGKNRNN